jgi:hypothetical protein
MIKSLEHVYSIGERVFDLPSRQMATITKIWLVKGREGKWIGSHRPNASASPTAATGSTPTMTSSRLRSMPRPQRIIRAGVGSSASSVCLKKLIFSPATAWTHRKVGSASAGIGMRRKRISTASIRETDARSRDRRPAIQRLHALA